MFVVSLLMLAPLFASVAPLTVRAAANPKSQSVTAESTSSSVSIYNSRLAVQVSNDSSDGYSGRFNMGAFPDPSTGGQGSNSWDLMYSWPAAPHTSYSTLQIDGNNSVYGDSGTQSEAPTNVSGTENESAWQIGDVLVTQIIQLIANDQTGQQDAAKITYTVENTGSSSHTVGLRMLIDDELDGNDGAVFRIPGIGLVSNETEFDGPNVPDVMYEYFGVTDSVHVAASTFKSEGATPPDRLVLANWQHLAYTPYAYTIDPTYNFTDGHDNTRPDSAYAEYWNPSSLAPHSSRSYSSIYGLASLTTNLQPPLALGVTGPTTLTAANGQYSPNPFTITGSLLNNGNATATNVQLTLNLPAGLTMASGQLTQTLGNMEPGAERDVSWSVRALSSQRSQTLQYSVTATAGNAPSKTVNRTVTIPGISTSQTTHYTMTITAWIPMKKVADPVGLVLLKNNPWYGLGELEGLTNPILGYITNNYGTQDICGVAKSLPAGTYLKVTGVQATLRGDGHPDFPFTGNKYRVQQIVTFDWDGRTITNIIASPASAQPSHLDIVETYSTTRWDSSTSKLVTSTSSAKCKDVATAAEHDGTLFGYAKQTSRSTFTENLQGTLPLGSLGSLTTAGRNLGLLPSIRIRADVTANQNGSLSIAYKTTEFPSIGIEITKNNQATGGINQVWDTNIVNNVTCNPPLDVLSPIGSSNSVRGLLSFNNAGSYTVSPYLAAPGGYFRSEPSALCPTH